MFSGVIIGGAAPKATLTVTIAWLLLLSTLSIPGTLLGAWATSHINRKYQLCSGFLGYTVLGLLIGLAYEHVTKYTGVFVVLYGLYLTVGCEWKFVPSDNRLGTGQLEWTDPGRGVPHFDARDGVRLDCGCGQGERSLGGTDRSSAEFAALKRLVQLQSTLGSSTPLSSADASVSSAR